MNIENAIRQRWDALTKPRGSLGRLEDAIVQLGEIQRTVIPRLDRRAMFVFCGDHGITEEGVSAYPSVVTREMVRNFLAGGAAINVLCREHNIETRIVDAGIGGPHIEGTIDRKIAEGTGNFIRQPAMSRDQAMKAIEAGKHLAHEAAANFDIAGVGEMGIGNTTSASALLCMLTGCSPEAAVGRGAGLDDGGLARKRVVISGVRRTDDPMEALAAVGGFEIAMMSGFFLGAAEHGLPVVADGFIGGAAFLVARGLRPHLTRHVFFGHLSAEPGHALILNAAGVKPLFDLDMRLGEGTGAALAIGLLTSALRLYREMATFEQASITDKEEHR